MKIRSLLSGRLAVTVLASVFAGQQQCLGIGRNDAESCAAVSA